MTRIRKEPNRYWSKDSIISSDIKSFYHGVSMKNHRDALQDMLNNKIKRKYKSQETIFLLIKAQYIPH